MLGVNQIGRFQEKVRQHPENALAHYNLGVVLQDAEKADEALVEYRKALELDSNRHYSALIHSNLGGLYYNGYRLEEAITEFEQAIEDLSLLKEEENLKLHDTARIYNNLGLALLRKTQRKEHYGDEKGDLERARDSFGKALEFDSNNHSAKWNFELIKKMINYGWSVSNEKDRVLKYFPGTWEMG